jgi:hypothetical protein
MKVEELTVEFVVTRFGSDKIVHRAKTHEDALQWIADKIPGDLLETVEYEIHKTYGNK